MTQAPPNTTVNWTVVEQTNETTTEFTPWCEGVLVRTLFYTNKGISVAMTYCPVTPGGKK